MDILTSNKPVIASLYISGKLSIDFRTRFSFNTIGSNCYIYSSSPVSKIVAVATIQNVIKLGQGTNQPTDIDKLLTSEFDKEFLLKHLNSVSGYLIKFKDIKEFKTPLSIHNFGIDKKVPLSWCWV